MEEKIMNLAVELPHAFPWEKSELGIEKDELCEILKKYNFETRKKRIIENFKVRIAIYKNISKSNNLDELINLTYEELKSENYISKDLIKNIMFRKILNRESDLITFKKLIDTNLTLDGINKNNFIVFRWLVDLVSLYMTTKSSDVTNFEVVSEIESIVKNNFKEFNFDKKRIEKLQIEQGFKSRENFEILYRNFEDRNEIFENLLSKLIKGDDVSKYDEAKGFDDLLSDFFESNFLSDEKNKNEKNNEGVNDDLKKDVENILKVESENFKGIIDNINNSKEEVKELKGQINQLKKEIYEEITKENNEITEEEENEIKIFKDLASIKKGAVISELYNAFKNIDNISKDNLEAVISNFFTSLRILGIEVDDEKSIGDEIKVDTKDVLKEFVFSKSISVEGEVNGTIEYLSWMYKGKKITPMVIKPNK